MHDEYRIEKYLLRNTRGSRERDDVFRFRYEHFFHCFADGYPGIDRSKGILCEPHDARSTHYCAFDAAGNLCAVSTSTPADAPDIPETWGEWFQLEKLAPAGLDRVVVSTRMVIHPEHRSNGLFDLFYRFIMERYIEAGFAFAVHYCSPGLICRYERLGHRLYGEAFTMPAGLLRIPMIIALNDSDYLLRLGSPMAGPCGEHSPHSGTSLQHVLPLDSMSPNFHLLSPDERLSYVKTRIGASRLPLHENVPLVLEHASPLRLRAGLSHTAPPSGGFLCLILSGAIQEFGSEIKAGPGSLVGTYLLSDPTRQPPSFKVLSETEVLVFDRHLTTITPETAVDPEKDSPWHTLSQTCNRSQSAINPTALVKEAKPCGTRL
jgi:hypothetical protein